MERECLNQIVRAMTVPGQPFYKLPMGSQENKIKCKTDQSQRG